MAKPRVSMTLKIPDKKTRQGLLKAMEPWREKVFDEVVQSGITVSYNPINYRCRYCSSMRTGKMVRHRKGSKLYEAHSHYATDFRDKLPRRTSSQVMAAEFLKRRNPRAEAQWMIVKGRLYWNRQWGWSTELADLYSEAEKERTKLPEGGKWVLSNPSNPLPAITTINRLPPGYTLVESIPKGALTMADFSRLILHRRSQGKYDTGVDAGKFFWRVYSKAKTNPRVADAECPKCHQKQGENHRATIKTPSVATLERWSEEGWCKATDGCHVEPDGVCSHGHSSFLLVLGLI